MPALLIAAMLMAGLNPAIAVENPFSGARSINVTMTRDCPARHVLMTRIKAGKKAKVKRCSR
jgi:hypothetical protein